MIVFLDGPNGAGKDYVIDRLRKTASTLKKTFTTVSFKDAVENVKLKNVLYERKEETINITGVSAIYSTHLKYIELILELDTKYDLVVVNRYVPSFYVYQHRFPDNDTKAPFSLVTDLAKKYIEAFADCKCAFIHLDDVGEVLCARLLKRDKFVDIEKQKRLQEFYRDYNGTIARMFPNITIGPSGSIEPSKLILELSNAFQKHFPRNRRHPGHPDLSLK